MTLIKSIYSRVFPRKKENSNKSAIESWEKVGKPAPPPHSVKQKIIKDLKDKFQCKLFVETGTYLGEMVAAQKDNFDKIFSIELGNELYVDAFEKFKQYKHIKILNGDSGEVLVDLCPQIDECGIFWLDGHYSAGITAKGNKDCPIYEELSAIFSSKPLKHILLIDDARLFIGENEYPTVAELTAFILLHRPGSNIYIKDDIIHVLIDRQ